MTCRFHVYLGRFETNPFFFVEKEIQGWAFPFKTKRGFSKGNFECMSSQCPWYTAGPPLVSPRQLLLFQVKASSWSVWRGWLGVIPCTKAAASIPGQGTCLDFSFSARWEVGRRHQSNVSLSHPCFSVSFLLLPHLPLSINQKTIL